MKEEILSVGIDIGTTTTQIIFSKITLSNTAGAFSIPNIVITEKKIIYKSHIYFTPLVKGQRIDAYKIKEIIAFEYEKAKIKKKDIKTGAVIITGETARKENAKEVLNIISDFAGDFVVATAGADLESILAGYGSGACTISKGIDKNVANFDVGGGTTNVSAFYNGKIVDSFALDIGARLVKFNDYMEITYVSKKIEAIIQKLKLNIKVGLKAERYELKKVTDYFSNALMKICSGEELDNTIMDLFITNRKKYFNISYCTFSGGVSEFVYESSPKMNKCDILKFHDIGPLLGASIKEKFQNEYEVRLLTPKEKIRATVIGAGSFSTKISGSTIVFENNDLPIKNVPIIKLQEVKEDVILKKVKLYEDSDIALAFKGVKAPSYDYIKEASQNIVRALIGRNKSIIVIVENDFAKALGQTIKNLLKQERKVICIDGIAVNNGDYVDIGKSISGVVPVVVKTLIFKN